MATAVFRSARLAAALAAIAAALPAAAAPAPTVPPPAAAPSPSPPAAHAAPAVRAPAAPAAPAGVETRPRLAVLDLGASGASASLAAAVGGVVANEIDRLGAFKVITADSIRAMLALEKQKEMLGCSADLSCLAEIGGALGVDYLVSGRVVALGGAGGTQTFTLDLTLSSVKRAQREGSSIETARSESELMGLIPRAVSRLAQKAMASRTGRLVLASSEVGAAVKVDDQVKGTTPLPGALVLPGGLHSVVVEKKGFVAWQKDVQVPPGRLVEERASLVPSPDFIKEYESRNSKLRLGAWIATGVAVAGAAVGIGMQMHASSLYGDASTANTFVYYQKKLEAGITTENNVDYLAKANDLKSKIESSQTLSYVGMGVGGAAAIGAAWLWIASEDPGRYARYRDVVSLAPLPGGALAAVTVGF
jgi:hypothetical protein